MSLDEIDHLKDEDFMEFSDFIDEEANSDN